MTDTATRMKNLIGTATNITVLSPKNGGRFARLTIDFGAKGKTPAKLSDKALARFESLGFGEGSRVDFFGADRTSTWVDQDGQTRTAKVFEVKWVDSPKTAAEIRARKAAKAARMENTAPAAQAPATVDATVGEEILF
jgi:hypothetical protein